MINDVEYASIIANKVRAEMCGIFNDNWESIGLEDTLFNTQSHYAPVTFCDLRMWIRKMNKILDLLEQHNESR